MIQSENIPFTAPGVMGTLIERLTNERRQYSVCLYPPDTNITTHTGWCVSWPDTVPPSSLTESAVA